MSAAGRATFRPARGSQRLRRRDAHLAHDAWQWRDGVHATASRCICRATAFCLRSRMRQMNGVKMISIASSILPPGTTIVFARDMNESCSIDMR